MTELRRRSLGSGPATTRTTAAGDAVHRPPLPVEYVVLEHHQADEDDGQELDELAVRRTGRRALGTGPGSER